MPRLTKSSESLTGQLLIAMPGMEDPRFQRTVIYMCAHSEDGACLLYTSALIDQGVPVLGVVYAPATGDLYAAAGPGTAVHWAEGRHDHPIAVRSRPADGLTVIGSRSHGSGAEIDAFLQNLANQNLAIKNRITCGSSLKFCTIASGKADLYPRFGPTSEWDTAAGHAVLTGAGGRVEQTDGSPLLYGKPDILNPNFVAYGW